MFMRVHVSGGVFHKVKDCYIVHLHDQLRLKCHVTRTLGLISILRHVCAINTLDSMLHHKSLGEDFSVLLWEGFGLIWDLNA